MLQKQTKNEQISIKDKDCKQRFNKKIRKVHLKRKKNQRKKRTRNGNIFNSLILNSDLALIQPTKK